MCAVNLTDIFIKGADCKNDLPSLTHIRNVQKHYLLVRIVNKININFGVSQSNTDCCTKGGNQKWFQMAVCILLSASFQFNKLLNNSCFKIIFSETMTVWCLTMLRTQVRSSTRVNTQVRAPMCRRSSTPSPVVTVTTRDLDLATKVRMHLQSFTIVQGKGLGEFLSNSMLRFKLFITIILCVREWIFYDYIHPILEVCWNCYEFMWQRCFFGVNFQQCWSSEWVKDVL